LVICVILGVFGADWRGFALNSVASSKWVCWDWPFEGNGARRRPVKTGRLRNFRSKGQRATRLEGGEWHRYGGASSSQFGLIMLGVLTSRPHFSGQNRWRRCVPTPFIELDVALAQPKPLKIILVLLRSYAKDTCTMKRLYTLIALLGLVGLMAGCAPSDSSTTTSGSTNTVPAGEAPASTNK